MNPILRATSKHCLQNKLLLIASLLLCLATVAHGNSPLWIAKNPGTGILAGYPYYFRPWAGDADGGTLTFSITNKPAWASFDKSDGALSGTPVVAQAGTYPGIVISVSDGHYTASLPSFAIVVRASGNQPPTISGVPPAIAKPGKIYSFTPSAADVYGDALTFSAQNLPNWLTLSPDDGKISGKPTSSSGTYENIVISVSDGIAAASLPPFTIVVGNVTATLASIAVTPVSPTVAKGSTQSFTATGTYSDHSTRNITASAAWTSASSAVASINSEGVASATGTGSTAISAALGGISGSTTLTVTAAALESIVVTPANPTVIVGSMQQFFAQGAYSDGTSADLTAIAAWQSSTTTTASITAGGLATALASGTSTISAATSGVAGATLMTVKAAGASGTDVVTYKNDLARTGQNLTESTLTLQNVRSATFGLLRVLRADGAVFAQPLYLSQLNVAGTQHNVVFVATEHNSVYAYDSDTGAAFWHATLTPGGETSSDDRGCDQISPEIGITATPVIDRSAGPNGAIYLVAMTKDSSGAYHQRLHALDILSGGELFNGPSEIQATYPTVSGGTTTFAAGDYKDRAALLLLDGEIYTTWASHCDNTPYGGWIIAYDEMTLAQTRVLNIGPNGNNTGPGIWMAGGGPAADSSSNIYLLSANGPFEPKLDANGFPSLQDYGNSFLKISTANHALTVVDYFAMSNEVSESAADLDLGSGGAMLLPDMVDDTGVVRHLVVGAGKDGNIYLVNRDAMGGFSPSRNNIWQQLTGVVSDEIRSTPAYFNNSIYYAERYGPLKAFSLTNAKLSASPTSHAKSGLGYPGTIPAISANGSTNGIVWAPDSANGGILHAYNAADLSNEIYNSTQAPGGRDSFGAVVKFTAPTIADGKVFVGTHTGVGVFGLLH